MLRCSIQSFVQTGVAINTAVNNLETSAMLDVGLTEKGLINHRMAQAQRTAIAAQKIPLLTKAQA